MHDSVNQGYRNNVTTHSIPVDDEAASPPADGNNK